MFYDNLHVFFYAEIVLKLGGVIIGHLEELVCQSHSLFPILFDSVVFV